MKINPYRSSQSLSSTEFQRSSVTVKTGSKSLWAIDQTHSEIGFKVKHLMISNIRGGFKDFAVKVITTNNDFETAEIALWINPASIDTGDAKRDEHLRSEAFFDTDNFPHISFNAGKLQKTKNQGEYILEGDLTIKNITRRVKLDVESGGVREVPYGHVKAGFSITGKISRQDFDLTWNASLEAGGMLIGDEISIQCDIQLIRPSQSSIKS
jgi:polyisoprenoid-binding protein YceI